jgi:hypothetical protein
VRISWVVLLFPLAAAPQTGALVGGILLERDAPAASGEFSIRAADNQVFRFRFDPQTHVERDGAALDVARLEPGEKVEVVADRMPHADLRYALAIRATSLAPLPPRALPTVRGRGDTGAPERPIPVGSLSFSGVISQLSGARVVLHMRDGADQTILLLKDTRYMDSGESVDAAALKPSMRVFVQAGKTIYGQLEAYQVVWGEILRPR